MIFSERMSSKEFHTGIVLSGGGMRCMAQAGILQALGESGIRPAILSGTSAGAIVACFYSLGYSAERIADIIQRAKLFDWTHISLRKPGLFDMASFEKLFREYFGNYTFESLPIPLVVNATDIITGESVYFSEGELVKPLLASCCIPVVFDPVYFKDRYLVDGGIVNNFSLEPIREKCRHIIGIHTNAVSNTAPKGKADVLDRSFHFALSASMKAKTHACDLFIEPPNMSRFSMFDFSKSREIFEAGYQYAKSMQSQIDQFISDTAA